MQKKHIPFFGILLIAILFSSACGNSNDSSVNEGNHGQGASGEKDPVELSFAYTGEGETYELYKDMFKQYESENPHVTIKTQVIANDFNSSILTRIAGGNAPDLFWISNAAIPSFASRDALLDLTPYDGELFDSEIFTENTLDGYSYEGKIFGIPADSAPAVLFYNRDLFDEANIDYPEPDMSYDELLEKAKELTITDGNNISQYGYAQDLTWFSLASHLWQRGGEIINEDQTQSMMDSPENIDAFNYLINMMNKEQVAPSATAQKTNPSNQFFTNGNVAMYYGGAWLASLALRDVDFKWDVVSPPIDEERANTIGLGGFSISKTTKQEEEAVKLLVWLAGEEGQKIKFEDGFAGLPSVKELLDSPLAIKGFEHPEDKDIQLEQIIKSAESARVLPSTIHWDEFDAESNKEFQLLWNGEQSVEETVKNIDEKSIEIFKAQ